MDDFRDLLRKDGINWQRWGVRAVFRSVVARILRGFADGVEDVESRFLKVYVAGASAEPERVRRWMDAIEATGAAILTRDWLAIIQAEGAANVGLDDAKRRKHAFADWRAVQCADLVWLLAPNNASTGAWVELGFALAAGRVRVVVSGPARERCIFAALAHAEYDTDEEAFAFVERFAKLRRE